MEDHIVKDSRLSTEIWVDISVKELPVGSFVQFERRCYARLDKKFFDEQGKLQMHFIFVPDGKSKGMSNIKNKVDAAKFAKGDKNLNEKEATKEAAKEVAKDGQTQEKKPKAEKKIDEAVKAQKMKEKAEKLAQEKAAKEAGAQEKKEDKPAEPSQDTTSGAAEQK